MATKFGEYTSAKTGNVIPTLQMDEVLAILNKHFGEGTIGSIAVMNDRKTVLCFKPKPPKAAGKAKDEKASKGAAGEVKGLDAIIAEAVAKAVAGLAAAQAPAPVKAPRKAKVA